MHITSLLDTDLLAAHVAGGLVRANRHPTEPLTLYCYTQQAVWTHHWDHVTRACRGLIVDDNGTVAARPFPKFFNLGEHGDDSYAGPLNLAPPITVYDKADGSLGIGYLRPSDGRLAFATKGSFTSGQAAWANNFIAGHDHQVSPAFTPLAEIIYPTNRIVLDYQGLEGLVLLGHMDIETGICQPPGVWPFGPTVQSFGEVDDPGIVAGGEPRPQSEGYVLVSADRRTRVKVKEAEYLRLHALLTECTTRTIWDYLRSETPLDRLYDTVPDEFSTWLTGVVDDLTNAYFRVAFEARDQFETLIGFFAPEEARHDPALRKRFAAEACKSEHKALLFMLLDGNHKKFNAAVWAQIKPEAERPFTNDPDVITAA